MPSISEKTRLQVRHRAGGCCEYCLSQEFFSSTPFSIEHINPVSKGGDNRLDNLALACQGCNGFKYNKTHHFDAVSQQLVPLYHPRKDLWEHHFTWNVDFTRIIGITPVGRTTIDCLKLNRAEAVNLRQLLIVFGEHPPKGYPKEGEAAPDD